MILNKDDIGLLKKDSFNYKFILFNKKYFNFDFERLATLQTVPS